MRNRFRGTLPTIVIPLVDTLTTRKLIITTWQPRLNTTRKNYDVVIVGAGIAGIAATHALAEAGAGRIALIDHGPPLGLTSDKSTECYRSFWPGPDSAMAEFISDSIGLLHSHAVATQNQIQLHQRGYLFATAQQTELEALQQQAETHAHYGGGELRHHVPGLAKAGYRESPIDGFDTGLDGTDLITDTQLIQRHFPYLTHDTRGVLHVRNCGVLSAHELGMYLFEAARANGVDFIAAKFCDCDTSSGHVSSVTVDTGETFQELQTQALVLATGPHLKATATLAGNELPVMVERHVKISLADTEGVIPRDAPLTIWNDPTELQWSEEDLKLLASSPETKYLCDTFPASVHGRPVGAGNQVFIYWTYDCPVSEHPEFPIVADDYYPEILLRGMTRMIPGLSTYLDPMPRPYVDGGYYTKVADNRPLIGALTVPGTYVCSAFSGYGIMAACGAGKLLASQVLGNDLPEYASAFEPERFNDPAYLSRIVNLSGSGQI